MPLNSTIDRPVEPTNTDDSFRRSVDEILTANGEGQKGWDFVHCREDGLGFVGHCYKHGPQFWSPRSCDLRICSDCAVSRSQTLTARYVKALPPIMATLPASWSLRHLTLTTSVSLLDYIDVIAPPTILDMEKLDDLSKIVRDLRITVRKFIQEFFDHDPRIGGIIGVEFGSAGYRLHFHIALLSPWIDRVRLSQAWEEASGGRGKIVYVVRHDEENSTLERVVGYVVQEVAAGVGTKESRRPSTQGTKAANERVAELGLPLVAAAVHFLLVGVRRVQPFGSLYSLPAEDGLRCACPICEGQIWWESELDFMRRHADGVPLNLKIGNKLPEDRAPPSAQAAVQSSFLPEGPQYTYGSAKVQ